MPHRPVTLAAIIGAHGVTGEVRLKLFAEGLESMLAGEADFELCGRAGNAADTLKQVPVIKPDVLLLDINLPDQSGLEVCSLLRKSCPDVKILALSMHNDESFISAMLTHGAQGYVLKNTGKAELCTAIRTLDAGKTYFSKEVTDTMMQSLMRERKVSTKEFIFW